MALSFEEYAKGQSTGCYGGSSVGGAALAKELTETGVRGVELYVLDLRASALETAREFIQEVWGRGSNLAKGSIEETHTFIKDVDVVLVYGNSIHHLDPLKMVGEAVSLAAAVKPTGVVVIVVNDLVRHMAFRGYRKVIVEDAGASSGTLTSDGTNISVEASSPLGLQGARIQRYPGSRCAYLSGKA